MEDWELVVASFQAEYGIRLAKDLDSMTWKEFAMLLNGLGAETPLVKIASIRAENDPKKVREFSPEAKKIRNEWRKKQFSKKSKAEQDEMLNQLTNAVIGMIGGKRETS